MNQRFTIYVFFLFDTDHSFFFTIHVVEERENIMDPIGQFYLPGYFCPAALIDSRETTEDRQRDRDNREIIVSQITRVKVTLKLLV